MRAAQPKQANPFVVLICLVVFFIIIKAACSSNESTSATVKDPWPDNTIISVIAEGYIKQYLKSPQSADFHPYTQHPNYIRDTADSIFTVYGYFDAKNAFNANLRSTYNCELKFNGGDQDDPKNFDLFMLTIDGKKLINNDHDLQK